MKIEAYSKDKKPNKFKQKTSIRRVDSKYNIFFLYQQRPPTEFRKKKFFLFTFLNLALSMERVEVTFEVNKTTHIII